MKVIIFLAIFALAQTRVNEPYITKEYLEGISINASFETFSFEEHPFKNWSEAQIKSLVGTITIDHKPVSLEMGYCDVPESFDGRVQWPNYIHKIRHQQQCGSCWAFAASEVLSDRFSVATQGQVNVVMSPEDLVSCDTTSYGCNGGYPENSWEYVKRYGLVSDECLPYSSGSGRTSQCPYNYFQNRMCPTGAKFQKYYASSYTRFNSICDIKKSLMNEGPVEVITEVFQDFISYRSGLYRTNCWSTIGPHAVKMVGWGRENGRDYWIIANSWGTEWGEQGFIRVEIGQSCLKLESQVYAPTVDVSRLMRESLK